MCSNRILVHGCEKTPLDERAYIRALLPNIRTLTRTVYIRFDDRMSDYGEHWADTDGHYITLSAWRHNYQIVSCKVDLAEMMEHRRIRAGTDAETAFLLLDTTLHELRHAQQYDKNPHGHHAHVSQSAAEYHFNVLERDARVYSETRVERAYERYVKWAQT